MSKNTESRLRTLAVAAALLSAHSVHAYQEAPELAEKAARGELPPVEERLPDSPAVVEPVESIGTYGGTWRRLSIGNRDIQLDNRMGYEPLVRWDRTGRSVVPGLAESWEILDEGRTYVFHLRKGLKWSDAHPLTSEDFLFVYEDWLCNKEITPIFPSWLKVGGEPVEVSAPDPHTVVYRFSLPYGIFLEALAFRGYSVVLPKHYLKQFHPRYVDKGEVERMAEERGLTPWPRLLGRLANFNENPDLPTWRPWKISVPPPARRMIAERNPYYWKKEPQ